MLDIELAGQQRSDDACLRLRPVKRTDRDDWSGRRIEPAWRVCIGQPSGAPAIAGRSAEHQLTSSEHHDVATRRCLDYSLLACDHFGRGDIESGRSVRRCIAQRVLMWHPVAHPMRPDPLAESALTSSGRRLRRARDPRLRDPRLRGPKLGELQNRDTRSHSLAVVPPVVTMPMMFQGRVAALKSESNPIVVPDKRAPIRNP